ncbi:hypothetical protein M3Y99_01446100 [Aphelenchoides fujianensis]|nr:hypothetical protein M3Y99_01446100 [Aphelenchoides fujianensis]
MTTVEQPVIVPPVPLEKPIEESPVATNGAVEKNGNGQPATNGAPPAETNGATTTTTEPEPPKDPRAEPGSWLMDQCRPAIHTAAFRTAKWVIDTAYADGEEKPELPAKGQLTRSQFVNLFKDGKILTKLADRLKPGASVVEAPAPVPAEGEAAAEEKKVQKTNIDAFTAVAKEHLPEEKFAKIFETLFLLAQQAPEKFHIEGINVEQFTDELSKIMPATLWEKIRTFVSRFVPSKSVESNKPAEQPAEQPTANGEPPAATTIVAEPAVPLITAPDAPVLVEEKKEEVVPIAPVN